MAKNKENVFNRHLKDYEESYFEHLLFSLTICVWLVIASLTLLVHALFPFCFIEKATRHIKKINQIMQIRSNKAKRRSKKKN